MKFYQAIRAKNILEGGGDTLTRHDWDADGGGTKGGYTQTTFSNYLKKYDLPDRDISTITPEEMVGINFHEYWMTTGAMMPDGIDFMTYQFGFVTYPVTANKILQKVMKFNGLYDGKIDGLVGPIMATGLEGISTNDIRCLLIEYSIQQKNHFVKVDEADGVIGDDPVEGWHNRVDRAMKLSLEDLGGVI